MKPALGLLGAVLLGLGGFLVFAGYFDRNVLVEVPATAAPAPAHRRIAAVYFSGDLGYRVAMGRLIGNRLASDGIPVVAVNSLGFFRQRRNVAEVTAMTARAIRRALVLGHADQIVLIGHSLGADTMQAGLPGLQQDLRAKVRVVILIVPTRKLYLQVSPGEMLDIARPEGLVLPMLERLTWAPLTCIYGRDEAASPCPHLHAPNVHVTALPGGHAMDWDLDKIHAAILGAIDAAAPAGIRRAPQAPGPAASPHESFR